MMSPFALLAFYLGLAGVLFVLHNLRMRGLRGPFTAYVTGLWFLTFILGAGGYRLDAMPGGFHFQLRLSTAVFVLIFAALLLAYVCEGIQAAREVITVSIGSIVLVAAVEVLIPLIADLKGARGLVEVQTRPSYLRMAASIAVTTFDLFFAVTLFQALWNRLRGRFLFLVVFLSMGLTMAMDSVLFLLATRPDEFSALLASHLVFKIPLSLLFALPMTMYIRSFQREGRLDLDRGSLDIFRRLRGLEADLAAAHEALKQHALNLEKRVEERTAELRRKQEMVDLELSMAREVQLSSLPGPDRLPGIRTAVRYMPASVVSGDVYEFGLLPHNRAFFFIADISGHGVPAALIGSMCKMLLSSLDVASLGPAEALTRIAHNLRPFSGSHYLTAFIAVVDIHARELVYASGAHTPAILLNDRNLVELPATGSLVAGVVPPEFAQKRVRYPRGARLVLYSDGVPEQKNAAREEYGMDRFKAALQAGKACPPDELCTTVIEGAQAFSGLPFADDATLLIADLE